VLATDDVPMVVLLSTIQLKRPADGAVPLCVKFCGKAITYIVPAVSAATFYVVIFSAILVFLAKELGPLMGAQS